MRIAGGGIMYCERYHCKMSKAACVIRRRNSLREGKGSEASLPGRSDVGCRGCEQGRAVAEEVDPSTVKAYSKNLHQARANALENHKAKKSKKRDGPATKKTIAAAQADRVPAVPKKVRRTNAQNPSKKTQAKINPSAPIATEEIVSILMHEREYHQTRVRALDNAIRALEI